MTVGAGSDPRTGRGIDDPSWVEVVGYRYEFLHTGVLEWLLNHPEHALPVARELTGRPDITWVGAVDPQAHAGGRRRTRPDLVAWVTDAGEERQVAVEMKVDSGATREQLEDMASPGSLKVLQAVGLASLRLRDFRGDADWNVVDLDEWGAMLDRLGALPNAIREYREAVRREVAEHHEARAVARVLGPHKEEWRLQRTLLEWAWLDEVAAEAECAGLSTRFSGHTVQSGPVLFWRDSWAGLAAGGGLYIDVMVDQGERRLAIKAGDVLRRRREVWSAVAKALEGEYETGRRQPAETGGGSFRIAQLGLEGLTPEEVAPALARADQRIREVADALI